MKDKTDEKCSQNELTMPCKYSVYVPSNILGKIIDNSAHTYHIATLMAKMFGGCTVTEGCGYWVNCDGEIVVEKVNVCCSHGTDVNALEQVKDIAIEMGHEMNQEVVSVECNGTLIIVTIE